VAISALEVPVLQEHLILVNHNVIDFNYYLAKILSVFLFIMQKAMVWSGYRDLVQRELREAISLRSFVLSQRI
jgi:hypothetical protein